MEVPSAVDGAACHEEKDRSQESAAFSESKEGNTLDGKGEKVIDSKYGRDSGDSSDS